MRYHSISEKAVSASCAFGTEIFAMTVQCFTLGMKTTRLSHYHKLLSKMLTIPARKYLHLVPRFSSSGNVSKMILVIKYICRLVLVLATTLFGRSRHLEITIRQHNTGTNLIPCFEISLTVILKQIDCLVVKFLSRCFICRPIMHIV